MNTKTKIDDRVNRLVLIIGTDVLLKEKIDYTGFQVWFVENWPKSIEMVRKADEKFWHRFQ